MEEYCYYTTCGLFRAKHKTDCKGNVLDDDKPVPIRKQHTIDTNLGDNLPQSPSSVSHELLKVHEQAINEEIPTNDSELEIGQPFIDRNKICQVKRTYGKYGKYTQYICTSFEPYNIDGDSHAESPCTVRIHTSKTPSPLLPLPAIPQKRSLEVTPNFKRVKLRRIDSKRNSKKNLINFVNQHEWNEAQTDHLERQLTKQMHEMTLEQVDIIDSLIDHDDERIVTPLQLRSEEESAEFENGTDDEGKPCNLFRYRAKSAWNRKSLDDQEKELLMALRDGVEEID